MARVLRRTEKNQWHCYGIIVMRSRILGRSLVDLQVRVAPGFRRDLVFTRMSSRVTDIRAINITKDI